MPIKIEDVVEGWKKGELTGDAAMCVIHDILYPIAPDEDDIKWAKDSVWQRATSEKSVVEEMYMCADGVPEGTMLTAFFSGNGYILLKDPIGQIYWRKICQAENVTDVGK